MDSMLADDKEYDVFKLYSLKNTPSVISLLFEYVGSFHQEHLPGAGCNFERPGVFHVAMVTGVEEARRKNVVSSNVQKRLSDVEVCISVPALFEVANTR
ncbi:hypothetical protein CDAR_396981 [Caerostris darwini]|uniref:Uncharacterized protein n=1 Tax=Caerostris darwini TaxID=1538125 RepID=A0AAV4Q5I7_9ARAC|nr:hypothetical protein CDAR_396981 [Caerostris darwini]